MEPSRTSAPCQLLHTYRIVVCLRSRRLRPGVCHQLTRSGPTSHSTVPPIVRRSGHLYRIQCLSWFPLYFVKNRLTLRLTTFGSGISMAVVLTGSRDIGTTNTIIWIAGLVCRFITQNSWSGWGPRNRPTYSDGHLVCGSGPWPRCRPSTLRASSSMMRTLWPPTLTSWSSTILACTVRRRIFFSWLSAVTVSCSLLWMTLRRCPVFAVPLHTWRLWASAAHRTAQVVQGLIPFTRAQSVPVALHAFCKSPVGDRLFASRTCGLFF